MPLTRPKTLNKTSQPNRKQSRAVADGRAEAVLSPSGAHAAGAMRVIPRDEAPAYKLEKKGKKRLKRWLEKFGVPGASLLVPLALPGCRS